MELGQDLKRDIPHKDITKCSFLQILQNVSASVFISILIPYFAHAVVLYRYPPAQ